MLELKAEGCFVVRAHATGRLVCGHWFIEHENAVVGEVPRCAAGVVYQLGPSDPVSCKLWRYPGPAP